MVKDEINTVLALPQLLGQRIVGQAQALEAIGQRIRTARAQLKPASADRRVSTRWTEWGWQDRDGSTLADILYGGERNMVTINMSDIRKRTRFPA